MKLLTLALVGISVAGLSAQAPVPQGGRGAAAQGRGAAAASGRAAPTPPPPAPVAGSPGNYKVDADLMAVLKRSIEINGDNMATSNIANTDQYSINIVRRAKGAGAIAHQGWTEVHHIIDGSATFVTGGTLVRPPAGSPAGTVATIEGGVSKHIGKGDVVVIPENSPHWYKDVDGSVSYLEVRFIAPKK